MVVKILKPKIFHGSTRRHALFRALIIALALSVVPLMELTTQTRVSSDDASVDRGVGIKDLFDKLLQRFLRKFKTEKVAEATIVDVAEELMRLKLLHYDSKVLCIGPGLFSAVSVLKNMGFSDLRGHRLFNSFSRNHVYELELSGEEHSFDFVFCETIDQITSPALLVPEMERVLKTGGRGVILASTNGKSASLLSFWLKQSKIVHVNYFYGFITLIVFKKNVNENAPQLPRDCQSIYANRPYIRFMEPLLKKKPVDFPKSVAYLPKFLDLSLKKKLVYIDIGAAEHMNANLTPNWFFPSYPIDSKAFNVYFVDHNTSVMLSYVKKPGIAFVYHPDLAEGNKGSLFEQLEPFPEDEDFDFLDWFEETAKHADFVVLKMNTSQVEMKFLSVLLETGAMCYVDELFLRCSNHKPDCVNILQTLRNKGVFVHQWWED